MEQIFIIAIAAFISLTFGLTYLISIIARVPVLIANKEGRVSGRHMFYAAAGISGFLVLNMIIGG